MKAICGQCSSVNAADDRGRVPPWCHKCGADLKSSAVFAPDSASHPGAQGGPAAVSYSAAKQLAEDVEKLDDRFGLHNLIVGLGLAVTAFVLGFLLAGNSTQKRLKIPPTVDRVLDVLQLVTVANGIALFVSGIGIRQRQTWGYQLAVASASIFVLAGLVFFAAFYSLTRIDGLEHSVALFSFIWTNLDFVAGFVDGGGLLYFLYFYHQRLEGGIGRNVADGATSTD